eukprot:m.146572 g.146572  ORF g.146572 m.146572 type:complete len:848 (+) comp9698_c0_seq1:187-2730(+)
MSDSDRAALLPEDEEGGFREWLRGQGVLALEDLRAWSRFIWGWLLVHWPLGPVRAIPPTESANFAVVNNEKTRLITFARKKREGAWRVGLRWTCLFLLGVSVAALYELIHASMNAIDDMKFGYLRSYMRAGDYGTGWIVHLGIMEGLVAGAALLALWEPMAAGGGVAEVISFLNGARPRNLLAYSTFICKAIGITLAVGAGVFLGPEGPFIHLGSIAGARIPSLLYLVFQHVPVVGTALESLLSDTEERNFVVAGAAVGISSAFQAPIGGTMFVLEEAMSFFDSKLIFRTYFACALSYFTIKLLSEGTFLSTASLAFSTPALQTTCYPGYGAEDLIMFALMGVTGGLLGVLFNSLFEWCQLRRAKYIGRSGYKKLIEIIVVVFVTSLFVALVPIGYGCSPVTQLAEHLPGFNADDQSTFYSAAVYDQDDYCIADSTKDFFLNYTDSESITEAFLESKYLQTALCNDGEYNELASLFQVSSHEAVTLLFSSGAYDMFHARAIAIFGVVYFFICVVTVGTHVPAGLFVPSMTIGACLGRLLAIFTNTYVKTPLGLSTIDPGPWATVGAAAFLSGSARITVTVAVIILEITGDFRYIPGIAIAVVFAKMTGSFFTKSIYHMMIHLKNIPFLEDIPSSAMENVFVRDIMTSPVVALRSRETMTNLRRVLAGCGHNGFPVIRLEKDERFQRRHQPQPHASSASPVGPASPQADGDDDACIRVRLCGVILRKYVERLVQKAPHDAVEIDMTSYMDETPVVVQPEFTMAQAFRMFRTLGLRHLPVVNRDFELQGVITRRNFLEPHRHTERRTTFELSTIKVFMPSREDPAADDTPLADLAAPTAVLGNTGETIL